MPSKHTINFAADEKTVDNLRDVVTHAMIEGVDLNAHGRLSRSKIIREAIRRGSMWSKAALTPVVPALLATTSSADADRLVRAMDGAGITSPKALAESLGYKDKASVQNVKTKGMKLSGRLLEWVERMEAGSR